jgi:hypothetical protein
VTLAIRSLRAGAQVRDDHLQRPPWLAKRKHSILVRGFVTIDGQAWEEARNGVETHLTPFFASAAFPQFPRLALVLRWRDRAKSHGPVRA